MIKASHKAYIQKTFTAFNNKHKHHFESKLTQTSLTYIHGSK